MGHTQLYAIVDPDALGNVDAVSFTAAVMAGGATWIQLRAKTLPDDEFLSLAKALRALIPKGVQFWVNDRADIAVLCEADGVHVGQEDLTVAQVRGILKPWQRVGVSTHTLAQVAEAVAQGADVLGFGPVFPTATKVGHAPVTGVPLLEQAVRRAGETLVVAIGGITLSNAAHCAHAGAAAVAVIGALAHAQDPQLMAQQMCCILQRTPGGQP